MEFTWAEALLPVATFWGVFNSQREAVKFLNDQRDTILLRYKEDHHLSLPHRRNMFLDWLLTYLAATIAFGLFSWLVSWMANHVGGIPELHEAAKPTWVIAIYMWITTGFLLICGVSDCRLLVENLKVSQKKK